MTYICGFNVQHSGPELRPSAQKVVNLKNRKIVVMSEVFYTDSDPKVGIGIEEAVMPAWTSTTPAPILEGDINVGHEEN